MRKTYVQLKDIKAPWYVRFWCFLVSHRLNRAGKICHRCREWFL